MMNGIDANNWLQQLPGAVRQAVDGNADGRIDTAEVVSFLEQLLSAAKSGAGTSFDAATGGVVNKATPVLLPGANDVPTADTPAPPATASTGTWRDFVYGTSSSGNYAGMMVVPPRDIPAGYQAGPFRHQLEGYNPVKFDPSHPEGMTLKMVAGRIFEQFDVYSDTAIDDVVRAFNEAGIPATKVGIDQIDFGNGEGPLDVIRNSGWLGGDTSAGMGWQWARVNESLQPMNFTMAGVTPLTVAGSTGTGAAGNVAPGAPAPGTPATGTAPSGGATGVTGASLYPGSTDSIDLGSVQWLHTNVSSWPVTSKITGVKIGSDTITIDHTKSGQWPAMNYDGIAVEGNPWVFVNRGGQWYGATYEWLRPGQTEKGVTAEGIGANIKAEPLASWRPQPGEQVGFMVSTPARADGRTVDERTNVMLTNWPA